MRPSLLCRPSDCSKAVNDSANLLGIANNVERISLTRGTDCLDIQTLEPEQRLLGQCPVGDCTIPFRVHDARRWHLSICCRYGTRNCLSMIVVSAFTSFDRAAAAAKEQLMAGRLWAIRLPEVARGQGLDALGREMTESVSLVRDQQ